MRLTVRWGPNVGVCFLRYAIGRSLRVLGGSDLQLSNLEGWSVESSSGGSAPFLDVRNGCGWSSSPLVGDS